MIFHLLFCKFSLEQLTLMARVNSQASLLLIMCQGFTHAGWVKSSRQAQNAVWLVLSKMPESVPRPALIRA